MELRQFNSPILAPPNSITNGIPCVSGKNPAFTPTSISAIEFEVSPKIWLNRSIVSYHFAGVVALPLLNHQAMTLTFIKSKRIPIPQIPPRNANKPERGLVIARIGLVCASVVIAAMLCVFLGA